ncbi:MAG: hypothetical protein CSB49_04010 [Proteobacteria bacterium]|nr:MAG: hypothetical protein CSB49_04010 [Pseudomonadota bacterium]
MRGSSGFREFVEEVRAAVDLVEVIGEDVQLKGSGHVLKGLSPFRSEQHPSFCVWPKDQRWYDFAGGDGQGGDVFSYVQQRDGVGFKEAVFSLAERKGIRRPDQDEEAFQKELALLVERREVERMLTKAAAYYHGVLPSKVREELYRDHYGFTDETVDGLMLGFADGHLFEHFREELKVSRELALKTGLFVVIKGGRVEDFFRDRLVFPYWKGGQVAYFIARSTKYTGDEAWEKSKYKKLLTHSDRHSYVSTTVRNDTFFGEDAVRGAEQILITEGITDAISARQAGIPCISPVTTRFRKQDTAKLLKLTRAAARVVICNDAEESGAGAAGALETASALHVAGRDVRIAVLPRPEGLDKIDVNEFLKANPPDAFGEVLDQAKRYVEHLVEAIPKETPVADLEPLLAPVLEAVSASGDIERDAYLDAIVKRFGIRRRALTNTLKGVEADQRRKAAARRVEENETPVVRVNGRQLRSIIEEAREVAVAANTTRVEAGANEPPGGDDPPLLFRRGGAVVRLKTDDEAAVELAQWGETAMFGLLARDADWVTVDEEGAFHPTFPPKDVSRDLVTFPPTGFPRVDSVITTPVFGSGGELIVAPGLHAEEHLWLQSDSDLVLDEVSEAPTAEDVARARSLFVDDLFVDFPFATDSDRAHMLAAVLLPFARRMVHGNTPLHVVESPSIGSGKSLLCHLTSIVCTGKGSDISTLPGQEEEIRKTLTAELLKGCPIIVLDNANERRVLSSQALAAALTAPTWRNRILGKTEIIVLPNLAMWMLTGNNPRLSAELTRRSIRIRIDPKRDRAWQRTGFKHDPISLWAHEHRSELVHAALVLIQAWIAAGKPRCSERLGSFEDWAAVMGGILEVIGVPGFLANLEQMYADADSEGEMWRELTQAWWAEFGSEPKRVSEINELCENEGLMLTVRGDGNDRSQQSRLGKALLGARDRMFGELRLVADRTRHRSRQYALEHASDDEADSTEPVQDEIDPWE